MPSELDFHSFAQLLLDDYKINERKSIKAAALNVVHLMASFGVVMDVATGVAEPQIRNYVLKRKGEGASNATINRELSSLGRMFTLAIRDRLLSERPHIPHLQENNVREGFVTQQKFQELQSALPPYLRDPITFLYITGWRVGEVRRLTWKGVDLQEKLVYLSWRVTKNSCPKTLPLRGPTLEIMYQAYHGKRMQCPFVFHRESNCIVRSSGCLPDFRKSWAAACCAIGLPGLLVHDLRRSAVRNFVNMNLDRKIAREFTGHKTDSVFERYHIINERDLENAAETVATFFKTSDSKI